MVCNVLRDKLFYDRFSLLTLEMSVKNATCHVLRDKFTWVMLVGYVAGLCVCVSAYENTKKARRMGRAWKSGNGMRGGLSDGLT